MKIKDFLKHESQWTKDAPSRDVNGKPTFSVNDVDAVRWCLLGLVALCYPVQLDNIVARIRQKLFPDGTGHVDGWNDAPERTFDDVVKLVNELDI